MNRKFIARQVLQQGYKVDSYVLSVGGTKFGELHGLGKGRYAFFFNDKPRLVAWMDTNADAFTWMDLKEAMENAKTLWEQRENLRQSIREDQAKPDALAPANGKRDGWVKKFVSGNQNQAEDITS